MDFLERITKQASEITMYDVTSVINKAKNVVLNLSEIEIKVRDCTTNEPWLVPNPCLLLAFPCQLSTNPAHFYWTYYAVVGVRARL